MFNMVPNAFYSLDKLDLIILWTKHKENCLTINSDEHTIGRNRNFLGTLTI